MLAARSDRDFVAAEPQRARTPRASSPRVPASPRAKPRAGSGSPSVVQGAGRLLWRGIALAARHPIEIAVALTLGGGGGWIAWNALAVQTNRHPAPLFGEFKAAKPEVKSPSRAVPEPLVTVPKPVTREPPPRDAIGDLIRQGEIPRASRSADPARPGDPPARPAPIAPKAPPPAPPRDPIGDLIRSGEGKPAPVAAPASSAAATPQPRAGADPIGELLRGENPVPPGYVGRADSSALVAAGQRALVKLGFGPLKADGLMGPSTRQAIERFERERKLPVTGELGSRTARELAAQSGLPVE
ncbi:MAG TPA: peptidoglycan-binding domain-containing protein [Microvirga sp.]|jgi:hypothetical protein|nr:peptidoglycan-binding domain-containing protein [Microvirga sp.]